MLTKKLRLEHPDQTKNAPFFYKSLVHGFWSFKMFKIIWIRFNLVLWRWCSKSFIWIHFFNLLLWRWCSKSFTIIMNPLFQFIIVASVQFIIVMLMLKIIMNPVQFIIVALMFKIVMDRSGSIYDCGVVLQNKPGAFFFLPKQVYYCKSVGGWYH